MPTPHQVHAQAFKRELRAHGGAAYLTSGGVQFDALVSTLEDASAPGRLAPVAPPSQSERLRYLPADLPQPLAVGEFVTAKDGSHRLRVGRRLSSRANPIAAHECQSHPVP